MVQTVPTSLLEGHIRLRKMGEAIARSGRERSQLTNLVSGATQQTIPPYSVHPPSRFVSRNQQKLLPDWSCPARSMLIVLQPCACDLWERSPFAEAQKRKLRRRFLQFGYAIAAQISHLGYTAALFDPRTGSPLLSRPGELRLDDVAVVQAALGYEIIHSHGCSIALHPRWGGAVYPSTLLSSAEPELLEAVVEGGSFEF